MPYIPTVSFQQPISPPNFIGPSQAPTDTILSLLGHHIDTTGIMTLSLPNSSASNAQQRRLLLPPPSVTLPIQHLLEPFTTPPSTSLNPSAANFEEQADLRVASPINEDRNFPMDEDRPSFANELIKTLNTAFTGAPQHTVNPLVLHDFPNDFDLNSNTQWVPFHRKYSDGPDGPQSRWRPTGRWWFRWKPQLQEPTRCVAWLYGIYRDLWFHVYIRQPHTFGDLHHYPLMTST